VHTRRSPRPFALSARSPRPSTAGSRASPSRPGKAACAGPATTSRVANSIGTNTPGEPHLCSHLTSIPSAVPCTTQTCAAPRSCAPPAASTNGPASTSPRIVGSVRKLETVRLDAFGNPTARTLRSTALRQFRGRKRLIRPRYDVVNRVDLGDGIVRYEPTDLARVHSRPHPRVRRTRRAHRVQRAGPEHSIDRISHRLGFTTTNHEATSAPAARTAGRGRVVQRKCSVSRRWNALLFLQVLLQVRGRR
jgi:hypothetical protein